MRHSCLQHETRPYSITARCNRIKPPLISKHGRCTKVFGGGWHEIFTVNFQWKEAARDQGQSRTNARNPFSTSFSPPFISRLFPFPTNTHRLLPHFRAVPAGKRHRQSPQVCPVGFSPANESRQSPLGGARVFRLCVLVAFKRTKMVVDSGGWVPWFFLGWWLVVVGTMMSSPWLESRVITRIRFLAMGGASVYIEFGPGSLRMTQVLQISRGVFVFKYCGRVLFDQCGQISFFLSLGFEGQ